MAGLFGFFNYDKEGPGISKNGPKKKTFIVFFETFFRNFWKFIPINLVYTAIFLPLLTSGIAGVGLTNISRNIARDRHSFGLSDFFETIGKNFKQALFSGIINTVVYALIFFAGNFYYSTKGAFSTVGLGITLAMFFIFTVMGFYLWTLIITFSFKLKDVYKNSFKFVFINMKYNLLCVFLHILIFAAYYGILLLARGYLIVLILEIFVFVLTYPAFSSLIIQYCTFPAIKKYIIDPYYKEHPELDIEKRRGLGLEIETPAKNETTAENSEDATDDDDNSDVIFED